MKLGSVRKLEEMKAVLKEPGEVGVDPVYWVFSAIEADKWQNLTVISPGRLGQEYPKTFGHFHGHPVAEVYHLISGEGVLLMQKKKLESGKWIENQVEEVILIKARAGDEILITPKWGHSWSNTSSLPLLSFDNWQEGHSPRDYEVIERLHGMAYYLIEENSEIKAVANPNYENLTEPVWMSAAEFKQKFS